MTCQVRPERPDVAFARHRMRNQHYSTAILQAMQPLTRPGARLLAVTSVDLLCSGADLRPPQGAIERQLLAGVVAPVARGVLWVA
jgi:hypothetical protein